MTSLYVYALLRGARGRAFGLGLTGEPVRLVEAAPGLWVATGAVAAAPRPDEDLLRAHDAVVRRLAARAAALLPVRFGTVVDGEAALARALAPRAAALEAALALVAGREQMTLRVFGRAARRRPPRPAGGAGTRYLAARARARTVPEIAALRPALAELVRAERCERHDGPRRPVVPDLIASVYHLIERGRAGAYRAALRRAAAAAGPRVEVSGPFAAYAFAPELP